MGISIKEPCTEDWAKMSATQQGAFCQKCAHEVIDFTGKSSFEIKSILAERMANDARVCGRIENRQLAEINDEFAGWKNAQEEVNTIWILSLIAVFGLTLFSCSNTLSKEMVNQIAIVSNEIVEKDSLEITEYDSLVTMIPDSNFWEYKGPMEGWTMGIMPQEIRPFIIEIPEFQIISCGPWMGDIIISGMIGTTEEHADYKKWLVQNYFKPLKANISPMLPFANKVVLPDNSSQNSIPLNGVFGSSKIFEVEITPIPITDNTIMYLNVLQSAEIHFLLKDAVTKEDLFRSKNEYATGDYELKLRLNGIANGNYVLFVSAKDQEERIELIL